MKEHVSYAMRNTEATESFIYFNSPAQLHDWSYLAIEWIIYAGLICAIIHAIKYRKETGSSSALLTLLASFLYGLVMDILSYYTVENFWHGEFSVMFLYNRLPLYIACLYPAFMYHSYMTIRRYNFAPLTEAICTGFFAGVMYLIFDNLGPVLGWWIWDTTDPTTFPYVNSVPLTSYHWFFTFTAAFALINRYISWEWIIQGYSVKKIALAHGAQPIATIFLGSLLFIPYNLFAKSSPPYDLLPWDANFKMAAAVHVITFSLAAWLFLVKWRKPASKRDLLLMAFPFIYLVGHAYLYIAKFDQFFRVTPEGLVDGLAIGNLIAVIIALAVSAVIVLITHPVSLESEKKL